MWAPSGWIAPPFQGPTHRTRVFRELLNRIRPFTDHAAIATSEPLSRAPTNTFTVEGWPDDATEVATAQNTMVSSDYFATLGIPLVRGRTLDERDDEAHPRAIVVNETMARTYWPKEDAIGKRIRPMRRNGPQPASASPWVIVVGIVGDTRSNGLDRPAPPQMYGSLLQASSLAMVVVMKPRDGVAVADFLGREVRAVDGDLPVYAVRPLEEVLARASASRRFAMLLVGLFGVAALVLAALGIYGVIAYTVGQQRHELGIRLALGAAPAAVLRMVLADGLRLTAIGLACGMVAAGVAARLLAALLFGVGPTDPATYAAIAVLLAIVAVAACWIPARRAASVDPLIALRLE